MEVSTATAHRVAGDSVRPLAVRERVLRISGTAATLLGAMGLLGWTTPWRRLASLVTMSIPMAPSSALAILLLGGTLTLPQRWRSPRLTAAVSSLVLLLSCVQLLVYALGLPPMLDALFVPVPVLFAGAPTGRMSLWTALGLMVASFSLLLIASTHHRHRALDTAGVSLGLAACLLGLLPVLGYLAGAPLFYGGPVVPIALPTALALVCLGVALLGLTPPDNALLQPFTSSSPRAKLLRAFLPIAPLIVLGELLFDRLQGLNPGLPAALNAVFSFVVVAGFVWYAAHATGLALAREEVERERSRRVADRLAAIVESSETAIYAKSTEGTIIAWNTGAERLFGYPREEIVGRSATALMAPGDEEELHEILETTRSGERVGIRLSSRRRKDGTVVPVSLDESPLRNADGDVVGISVIANDVSERVRAEEALRESEASFRDLAEAMPQMVWITRGDGWNVYFNQRWMDYTGLTAEESHGHGWSTPFHPDDRPRAEAAWEEATVTGGTYSLECRLRRADGVYTWWLVRGVPQRDAAGAVVKWYGTCTDIDDLLLAERRDLRIRRALRQDLPLRSGGLLDRRNSVRPLHRRQRTLGGALRLRA